MLVGRDERRVERFGERHVQRVIRGEVIAKGPSAFEERDGGIAGDGEDGEILDRRRGALRVELAASLEAPERVQDLRVEEIRGRRSLLRIEDVLLCSVGERKTQEKAYDRGGVDDAQRPPSRRRRMTVSGRSRVLTGVRSRSRIRTSSGVGSAATRASSARKYSESEVPD